MSTAIIIRTYYKDIKWLDYCLRSLDKFGYGFKHVIVLFPKEDLERADWSLLQRKQCAGVDFYAHAIETVIEDGYIDQQHTKMTADFYTDADEILFVDSDTMFLRRTGPSAFSVQGKPYLLYTPYDRFPAGTDMPWQEPTERAMSHHVAYEFMRRLPITIPREAVIGTREYMQMTHGVTLADYLRKVPFRTFSEFNVMGAFVYYHNPGLMALIPTEVTHLTAAGPEFTPTSLPPIHARQFWSWGNEDVQMKEADEILDLKYA